LDVILQLSCEKALCAWVKLFDESAEPRALKSFEIVSAGLVPGVFVAAVVAAGAAVPG
jgi:hypothetical protein